MAATIFDSLLGDVEDTAKSEASKLEQNQDRFTIVNGQKTSGRPNNTSLGMDSSQETIHSGSNESDPSSKPAPMDNEADDYSTDSEDDNTQPQPQLSDRKRTQYKKFSSWSVLC